MPAARTPGSEAEDPRMSCVLCPQELEFQLRSLLVAGTVGHFPQISGSMAAKRHGTASSAPKETSKRQWQTIFSVPTMMDGLQYDRVPAPLPGHRLFPKSLVPV